MTKIVVTDSYVNPYPFGIEVFERQVPMPTKEEVDDLVRRYHSYPKEDMVLLKDWAGDCFKTLFDGMIKELAEEEEVDQWDYLACLLHKLFER